MFGGQGDDLLIGEAGGAENLLGNEGNDTFLGGAGIDTSSGGSGADVFRYDFGFEDGNNANGGGPVERITDVNFDEDRFRVSAVIAFAAQTGAGAASNLETAADNALGAAWALAGMGAQRVAAQFDFNGRTYLAIDMLGNPAGAFADASDLLLDITGATGTIGTNDFFV